MKVKVSDMDLILEVFRQNGHEQSGDKLNALVTALILEDYQLYIYNYDYEDRDRYCISLSNFYFELSIIVGVNKNFKHNKLVVSSWFNWMKKSHGSLLKQDKLSDEVLDTPETSIDKTIAYMLKL